MAFQVNKKALFFTILLATSSTQVMATGGGGGGYAGGTLITMEALENHWNGYEGLQQTPIAGVMAQWYSDNCGFATAQVNTPGAWGAPVEISTDLVYDAQTQIAANQQQESEIETCDMQSIALMMHR